MNPNPFPIFANSSGFVIRCLLSVYVVALIFGSGSVMAEQATAPLNEPQVNEQGEILQKIIHRPNPETFSARPWEKNALKATQPTSGSTGTMTPNITYHGGTIMSSLSAVYIIWYGNWKQSNGSDNSAGQQIIRDSLYGLSKSGGYTNITTGTLGYYNLGSTGSTYVTQVSSAVQSEYIDSYSQGEKLSDSGVLKVVENAIAHGLGNSGGTNTAHSDAIYLVLTSSDVSETSGFCTRYCGWHTYTTYYGGTTPVKYAFIGNANRCLSACAAQTISPNSNAGVDAMVSVIAHELEESVTDPLLNAWYDSNGSENADKCAWTFGSSQTLLSGGAYANAAMPTSGGGSRNYLMQRALAPSDSKCYINASSKTQ